MKQAYFLIITVLAVAILPVGTAGTAHRASLWQEQGEKQKAKEKGQDESSQKISGALGTKTNPVRCEDPKGERQYLNRLRCSDGKPPTYSRIGSFGVGPYGNILDGYTLKCEDRDEVTIFMDMYHEGYIEKEAVPGFTIVDE
jgi:hypothetical protein